MLHPGKIPPAKTNSGISHNFGKTTSHLTKTSIILKVPTSSTLPPNYSIRAKGSTSQSFYFEPWVEKACFGSQGGFKIKTFMAFSISATLGFHGGSLASSGTSALQDRATGLVPSFPEWLKVFFEDCGNENEFVDSEKTLTEVSKTSNFEENPTKKSIVVKVPTSSTLPPNYSI